MRNIKIRIAVVVNYEGEWYASGTHGEEDPNDAFTWLSDEIEEGEARYWVDAEVAVPETISVEGIAVPVEA